MTNKTATEWPYPGARWWKFDFHTHTPASSDTYWHGLIGQEDELKPERWLQRYMDAEIDCVAITDHNSGAWIDKLKSAYERMQENPDPNFRKLYLFPGIEISVNVGFHLLAILDKNNDTASIDTLIGKIAYDGTKGDSNGVTRKSPVEVIESVVEAGGIPIPAHVDSPKGLLRVKEDKPASPQFDANTVRQVLEQSGILAVEVINRQSPRPLIYTQRNLSWSEVIGSDCHNFRSGFQPGSRFTWVKMEEPSLEGLRLALLDGDGFSIRRSDDPEQFHPFGLPKHFIEAIEIRDAQYMGRDGPSTLKFNPWLNALVGGRGTGKSTVIHALRLAARRDKELTSLGKGSEALSTFQGFNRVPSDHMDKGGLTSSATIQWTVVRDSDRYRVHWKQDGSGTVLEEAISQTDWEPASVQTITPSRFPVRIFSQGQISELAGKNQQALLQVVDEAAGIAELQRSLNEVKNAFFASRAQIRKLDGKLVRKDDLLVEQHDVERKLKRFEEAGHTAILTSYRLRGIQRKEADRQIKAAEKTSDRIEEMAETLQAEDLPDGIFDKESEEDKPFVDAMDALAAAVTSAAKSLRDCALRLRQAVKAQQDILDTSIWQKAIEQAESDYTQLVNALSAEGVADPSGYGHLVQERQRIEGEIKSLESMREERTRLEEQSQDQLKRILEARRAVSARRKEYLKEALAQNKFVRIEIQAYGAEARAVEHSLREVLGVMDDRFQKDILLMQDERLTGGIIAELFSDLPTRDPKSRCTKIELRLDSLKDRIVAACAGSGNFGGFFNNYLSRELAQKPEMLDRILAWFPEDGLSVQYSRGSDGRNFRPINQASAGQRSAAMLAFLLAHGEEPLVLDQPEDDLDNHLIYELIVRQIRENKFRRQIIVVTHNPNIVVNGDAEMLHALDFNGRQCVVSQSGSLQKKDMREEVCQIMEGGREAFERRYRRLGPEPTYV